MQRISNRRWALLAAANVLCFCVLGFYQPSGAEPRRSNQPFANAEEQREEMINLLRDLNTLVKEQNALLRSGNLNVVLREPKKR